MLHHLSLPSCHTASASSPPEDVVPHGQPVSHARMIPHGFKRARIFSHVRSYPPDGLEAFPLSPSRDKENFRVQGAAPNLSPICSEDEEAEGFDPADSSTWGVKTPPFLHNGAMLPVSRRLDVPRTRGSRDVAPRKSSSEESNDGDDEHDEADIESLLLSPAMSSPRIMEPVYDHQFLKIMEEKLRLGPSTTKPSSPCPDDPDRRAVRAASSTYPSNATDASTRVHSPASFSHSNKLSLSELSRFGQANDRLSNLRSGSSVGEGDLDASRATENHEVLVEADTAIAQWQTEIRPRISSYNQYELVDSTEVLPCDSMSQPQSPKAASHAVNPHRPCDAGGLTWDSVQAIKGQYDGVHEGHHHHHDLSSPNHGASAPPYTPLAYTHKQSKRKASVFSLRSLSTSLAKRPRLGFRRWASNVWQQSSHRLNQARQKWRLQAESDRQAFEAWRIRLRKADNQADGGAGSKLSEKDYGTFAPDRKTCGSDDWWKDGVSRYEAPKWMLFRG